jgi:hypothetical protein
MRIAITIATAAFASASLWGAALAEPAATYNPAAPAPGIEDCRKAGNDVSALIDNKFGSPNLPAARAIFQVGVMECMEGDEIAANSHYNQAKALLNESQAASPAAPAPLPAKK